MTTETGGLDLGAVRARADAASSGPWYVVGEPWNNGLPFVISGSPDPHFGKFVCDLDDVHEREQDRDEDAEFIAAARTDVPALLAEVEQLRKGLRFIVGTLSDVNGLFLPDQSFDGLVGEIFRAMTDAGLNPSDFTVGAST